MGKRTVVCMISIASILFLWMIFINFREVSIIENVEKCNVVKVAYNPYFDQKKGALQEISAFDENKILSCLSNYKEKKTFNKCKGGYLGEYQLNIYVAIDNKLKIIALGNENFSCYAYGSSKYKIIDAEHLKYDLISIIEGDD